MLTKGEFQKRYNQIEDLLFGFAMKLTRNRENAKDLIQETVLRAFRNRDKYAKGTNYKAWMTTIMRNTFINSYRKKRTRKQVEAPIEDFLFVVENKSINGDAESIIMMRELREIIGNLSDAYRIPFILLVKGYQYAEISEKLDLPMGTVKSRIFAARSNLRSMVKSNYGRTIVRV